MTRRRVCIACVAAVAALTMPGVVGAAPATAAFGFQSLDLKIQNEDGSPATQAGSHPFAMTTTVNMNTTVDPELGEVPDGELKDLSVQQAPGLVGDPTATPRCSMADFLNIHEFRNTCPDATAVGYAKTHIGFASVGYLVSPVYNLQPTQGEPARLGFAAITVPVTIDVGVLGSGEHNLLASVANAPQTIQFYGSELTLWGAPESPVHDPFRGNCLNVALYETASPPEIESIGNCHTSAPVKPFLTLPSSCTGPLATNFAAESWQGDKATGAVSSLEPVGLTGCDKVGFAPEVGVQSTTGQADSPTGLNVGIDVDDPGLTSPTGTAQSEIKKAVVRLPEGVTVNPSAAEGLGACTAADFERESVGSAPGEGCPESSKIGTVEVETPLLEEPLGGSVFVAQQDDPATSAPGAENPFDSLLAVYVVIKNPTLGIIVKLAGKVEPSATTGQLVTTFEGLPQLPFSHFSLHFREGSRAPLISPPACGTYTTTTELTPWANPGATQTTTSSFDLGSGPNGAPCPSGGFGPSLSAGTVNPIAGSYSPFALRLSRQDGTQRLLGLDLSLPSGLTGKLAGIPYCPDDVLAAIASRNQPGQGAAEIASPSCPAASQLGTVVVGAGAGPTPVYVNTGRVYLAGPYKGAPLSLAIDAPAVAGPFDLGNVVVRTALHVDPSTAQIRAVSDPLPTILHGVPLDLRDVRFILDRSEFTLNPTSCDPMGFVGSASSVQGATAPLSERFQVGSCERLGFAPKLRLDLKGKTVRSGHPQLTAQLTAKPGEANIGRVSVVLPHSEFLAQNHIRTVCTRVQFVADACPQGSIYGYARALTPLLEGPLEGPVYLRANGGERELPDLVAALHGQIDIDLVGYIDSVNAQIRTRFQVVPDAPVQSFTLKMKGGKQGLLENSTNLCKGTNRKGTNRATVKMGAQNGKVRNFRPSVSNGCGKRAGRHARGRAPRGG